MNQCSIKTRKNNLLFGQMISLILIILLSSSSPSFSQITIELGKKLYNIDDIRLGDFSITESGPSMIATVEVTMLSIELLKLNGKNIPNVGQSPNAYLKLISNLLLNEYGYDKPRKPVLIWSKDEQIWLDKLVFDNYNQLLQNTPDLNVKALLSFVKAQHLFTNNKFTEGMELLNKTVADYPGTEYESRSELETAFRQFKIQMYAETIEQCKKILSKFPNTRASQDANYFIARAYHLTNKHDDAVKYFDELINKYPKNKWNEGAKYFRAKSNYYLDKIELANQQFEEFISEYPKSDYRDDAREMMAAGYANNQNFEKAIEMFEKYKLENPSVLDQMAADGKIMQYYRTLSLKLYKKSDINKKQIYDSLVSMYPNKIEKYIKANKNDNSIIAQGYYAIAQYYIVFNKNIDKALEYLGKLDSPSFITDTITAKDVKGCKDCNYGLIYRPNYESLLISAYLEKGLYEEVKHYKMKLLKKGDSIRYYLIVSKEAAKLINLKEYQKAEEILWNIYNDLTAPSTYRAYALYSIGGIYYSQGDKAKNKPEIIYKKILDEFPDDKISSNVKRVMKMINQLNQENQK
jgi:TolA-binding protein